MFEILLIDEIHTVDADDAVYESQLANLFWFFFSGKYLIMFHFRQTLYPRNVRETPKTLCARKALHPLYAVAAFHVWTSKRFSPVAVHLTENNIYPESKKIALWHLWHPGPGPEGQFFGITCE